MIIISTTTTISKVVGKIIITTCQMVTGGNQRNTFTSNQWCPFIANKVDLREGNPDAVFTAEGQRFAQDCVL
jgi:hypothetical protein